MRILYLTEVDIYDQSSLMHKMNAQIDLWNQFGHEVHVLTLNGSGLKNNVKLTSSAKSYKQPIFKYLPKIKNKSIYRLLNKILSIKVAAKEIMQINPDIIYLREIVAFPGIDKLLTNHKVVLEANTLLKEELKNKNYAARKFYDLFQKLIYNNVDGFIGVTNEISAQFARYMKPSITVTNGIKLDALKRSEKIPSSSINIIFVGSPGLPWHGVDKYKKMALLFPNINFHLVGPVIEGVNIPNLICHGYLEHDKLYELYTKMDIGIGSLALHRNKMEEACPLKVREYGYHGLPIIIAYFDTDFSGQEFVLELPNTELCIEDSFKRIEDFIMFWRNTRIDIEKIRPLISLEIKERDRIHFFHKISSQFSA